MRNALFALAVLSAGCTLVVAADIETEHISQTAALAPGGTLRVKNFSGRVTITGEARQNASIEATRRADRERLDHIKLDIHTEGSTLVVNANHKDYANWSRHNRIVETDLDIKVPKRTNLEAEVFSAPLFATGLEGSHRVHGFSSRIRLEDMIGSIRAHSFSGSVEIAARNWQPDQLIDVDTFSGSINVRVPETARGTVTFNSFSGQLNSDVPLMLRTSSRRSLRAELGASGPVRAEAEPGAPAPASKGSMRFKTFSGSVRINR
jgi:hypothetical protein